jgi:VIT1/CCC1 family predicted Fe2+/Mn2+ transporter
MFGRAPAHDRSENELEIAKQIDGEIRQALQLNASAYRRVEKQAERNIAQAVAINEAIKKAQASKATLAAEEALDLLQGAKRQDGS